MTRRAKLVVIGLWFVVAAVVNVAVWGLIVRRNIAETVLSTAATLILLGALMWRRWAVWLEQPQ